ncbi:MAG: FmdB family transcriptional regulator [Actinobacteria bacterium]|nr:FmdB family transcriptional regulator [Actinomycetota bacterium]
MPTYVYRFIDTDETIEVQQSFTDDALTEAVHPTTGETMPVKKVFQPIGVTFKGGGFYKNDARSSSGSSGSSSSTTTSSTTTSETSSTSSPSSDSSSTSSSSTTSTANTSTSTSTSSD